MWARKVAALAHRINSINPSATVTVFDGWVSNDTAPDLVASNDIIYDTVDLIDLSGITALHDESRRQGKPLITCASSGWGSMAIYFPPDGKCTFRQLFRLPEDGGVDDLSYVERFSNVIDRLRNVLAPEVMGEIVKALSLMEDGKPCPAPHLSVGAGAVASLAVTMAVRILAGLPVDAAPKMLVADMGDICTRGMDVS